MARLKKELTEGTASAEKKVKVTPFMNASRIIRQSTSMTTEQYEKLAELCLQRIEEVKADELNKLKAERAKLDERIKKLEG